MQFKNVKFEHDHKNVDKILEQFNYLSSLQIARTLVVRFYSHGASFSKST